MSKILTFIDYYYPAFKAGGPPQSMRNIVARLSSEHNFWIFTSDRDLGDNSSFTNVEHDNWTAIDQASVRYTDKKLQSFCALRRTMADVQPDIVYLNSFFSRLTIKYLVLRRLHLIPHVPTVLAPRGEFSPEVFRLKRWKKTLFIYLVRFVGLYSGLIWHASAEHERSQIINAWRKSSRRHGSPKGASSLNIHIAPNLVAPITTLPKKRTLKKIGGEVSLAYLSRISPNKNLLWAMNVLGHVSGNIELVIYGPIESVDYWKRCLEKIKELPEHIHVEYRESIPTSQVQDTLKQHHFFLLPTLGENFGHAIFEAMLAGCPPIISDKTQWRDLESQRVGWDLPLDDERAWQRTLARCVEMGQADYDAMANNAFKFASQWASQPEVIEANANLFRLTAIKRSHLL